MLVHFFIVSRGRIVRFDPMNIGSALIQLFSIHVFLAIQQDHVHARSCNQLDIVMQIRVCYCLPGMSELE